MSQQSFPPDHLINGSHHPQHNSLYSPSPSPAPANRVKSTMTAPKNYQTAPQYHSHGPPQQMGPPPPPVPPKPADPLEQRVLDLLYPYRDECFTDDEDADATISLAQERMAHILSGKLSPSSRALAHIASTFTALSTTSS